MKTPLKYVGIFLLGVVAVPFILVGAVIICIVLPFYEIGHDILDEFSKKGKYV